MNTSIKLKQCIRSLFDYCHVKFMFENALYHLKTGDFTYVDNMINNNFDINIVNSDNSNLLIEACKQKITNLIDVMNYLINKKIDVNKQDNEGYTALMYTACHVRRYVTGVYNITKHIDITSNLDAVKILVNANADPNIKNKYGNTALIMISYYGDDSHLETVKYLKNITDINIKNNSGKTAAMITYSAHILLVLNE